MTAVLYFRIARQTDLFSEPLEATMPNSVLVTQFAKFMWKIALT